MFEGILFKVYQWEQKLFDGTTRTFEKVKRLPSVQVITIHNDKILIQKEWQPQREKPFYSFTGGMTSWGEEPLAAAKRELLEETGMQADVKEAKVSSMKGKIDWPTTFFIATNPKKVAEPKLDGGEKIEITWRSYEEFKEIVLGPDFRLKGFERYFLRLLYEGREEEFKKELFENKKLI